MSLHQQPLLDTHDELCIDIFAGGGGASSGFEHATGRMIDIAINHDAAAVAMHKINHPQTRHIVSDVFDVCPTDVTLGRLVAFLWASPDCTFHSKARGRQPIRDANRKRRALAWIVTRWAAQVRPRVIMLENVEEFAKWGPLVGPPDDLRPCPKRRGRTFRKWVKSLVDLGYEVEWRELRACEYGAPTIRKRLYLIARCDGRPIIWPEQTHGPGRKKPYRTAAECIDWSIPMLSIFATPQEAKEWGKLHNRPAPIRPLADNTLKRIARGVMRFVVHNPTPFLVTLNHGGAWQRPWDIDEPVRTLTAARDAHALVSPHITKFRSGSTGASAETPLPTVTANSYEKKPGGSPPIGIVAANMVHVGNGERDGQAPRAMDADVPLNTIVGSRKHALVASFLSQHNGGFYDDRGGAGRSLEQPNGAVCASGSPQSLVAAHMQRDFGTSTGSKADDPLGTITTEGGGKGALVASFLSKFYGQGIGAKLEEPAPTATTVDRFGLVTVNIGGEEFFIDDIAMRMLQPRELYRAQGFREGYVIDRGADGRKITKTEQVRMCGNSVCPPVATALVRANCPELTVRQEPKGARSA